MKELFQFVPKINIEKTLFFSILLFLPTQFGKHFWPPFASVLGQRIDYLSPTLYWTDILIFLLFIYWLLHIKKQRISLRSPLFCMAIFFVFLVVRGVWVSSSPLAGIYGIIKLLECIFLGVYTKRFFSTYSYRFLFFPFSCALIGESILAILQYIHQGSLGGILYFLGERLLYPDTLGAAVASLGGQLVLRSYGTFSHPNVLAAYLLIGMLFVSRTLWSEHSKKEMLCSCSVLGISTIALFVTFSRVAIFLWIALCGCFLLYSTYKNMHKKRSVFSVFFPLVMIIALGALFFYIHVQARFVITSSDTAVASRLDLAMNAVSLIQRHPFVGVGLNNYWHALGKTSQQYFHYYGLQPVHNIYLFILAEIGFGGFVVFCVFMTQTYWRLWEQGTRLTIYDRRLFFIALTIILTLGFFDHYFLTLQQGQLLFSFVLGLCWSCYISKESLSHATIR